ncbi:MAG: BatD family protein, partial [Gammaproteobacteria bacterium]|nr:BatD family protein [Gammaproteobacteria bacterium]
KVAVIPSVPGVYEMPAISVRWWNTERDRLEYAELPAQRIQVLPATGIAAPASQPADPAAAPQPPAGMVPAPEIQGDRTAPGPWPWVSAALGLFWIATLAAWWWQSRRRAPSAGDARVRSLGEVWRDLKGACSRNDPGGAKDCLLAWALLRWPDDAPRSIGDIAERCELEFAQCLRKLDAHLYGREQGTWDGSALWRAFAATRSNRHTDDEDAGSELEPLHRI